MFSGNAQSINAEIISIGNELVSGFIEDTNSSWLSRRMQEIGINISQVTLIGDDGDQIKSNLEMALQRVNIIILTGGLGCTHDDITKQTLCEMFDYELKIDNEVKSNIEKIFNKRGRSVPQSAFQQARVPDGATILYNEKGTAPGLKVSQKNKCIYALPGIPLEMKHLTEEYLVPELSGFSKVKISHRLIKTTGIVESSLWEKVGPLKELESWVQVASLPSHLGVRIRLSSVAENDLKVKQNLEKGEFWLRRKISKYVFGVDDETLEGNIGQVLKERGETLAVAESCTGGLVGHRLTSVPGSSEYFIASLVTYSNISKVKYLGVDPQKIEEFGAVSSQVAQEMAEGVRVETGADYGIAITGIAGPSGGTDTKPVGLTYIAISDIQKTFVESFNFHQDREKNKERAAQAALNLLRIRLIEKCS